VQRYLECLCRAVKEEDPQGLVTYVNYPSTEYLELPFLDVVSFNVYLERRDRLEAYLERLHALAGDRPLIMSELGLDALRNGERVQAEVLDWQVRTVFAKGCAGAFVFSWTDEWYRGGEHVEDWAFGLTRRDRSPKPALDSVSRASAEAPFPPDLDWPHASVVVCSHNGARWIGEALVGLMRLDYSSYEVIVVDDGSTDGTGDIAGEFDVRVVRTPNEGLSAARNRGLQAATGEIVAFIDDDATPDPHWLTYLVEKLLTSSHVGVGGPNIPPPGDGFVADCVAHAPGGPVHVLVTDELAEHVPGCNMAFRKAALDAIGGFDEQFRIAGDDVDVCWRLQQSGGTIGFSPAAVVWHHRRNSIGGYLRQQRNYGRAEALLERKWPERYNALGHAHWSGRVYGNGIAHALARRRGRIYHGLWGSAPFQSVYHPAPGWLAAVPALPEWYLGLAGLAALSLLGIVWSPLLVCLPLLGLALLITLGQAVVGAARLQLRADGEHRIGLRVVTALLYLLQPIVRLAGRLGYGLTPWRRRTAVAAFPRPRRLAIRSERWEDPFQRLGSIAASLRAAGSVVRHGGEYGRWDLEVRGGVLASARLLVNVEDHGRNAQLVRVRVWPRWSWSGLAAIAVFAGVTAAAFAAGAWVAGSLLAAAAVALAIGALRECSHATGATLRALEETA
jgi:GT2 family glycosyltransferase